MCQYLLLIGHLGCFQTLASINATPGPGSMEFAKVLLRGALQLPRCVWLCRPQWCPRMGTCTSSLGADHLAALAQGGIDFVSRAGNGSAARAAGRPAASGRERDRPVRRFLPRQPVF